MKPNNSHGRKRQQQLAKDRQVYYQRHIEGTPRETRREISFHEFRRLKRSGTPIPIIPLPEIIKFWASRKSQIGIHNEPWTKTRFLFIPRVFSLTDEQHQTESFQFIYRLFDILYYGRAKTIHIDYVNCEQIDVDASVCMDVLLEEFIRYFKARKRQLIQNEVEIIKPLNYNKDPILKVLFSIGGFSLINGINLEFSDIIPLPLQVGCRLQELNWERRAKEVTIIMDYVEKCLKRTDHALTDKASEQLYVSIGEVLANADEHATTDYRYSIGYFQESQPNQNMLGILQLTIMNFGDTIYEKFTDSDCPNQTVVKQMRDLSAKYTANGWFRKAVFEEEALWTLYALQQGVTSIPKKRGNGFISLIDRFFGLKGDTLSDNMSQMTIISGNTRIIFDGTHQIKTVSTLDKNGQLRDRKIMSFNTSGSLRDQPDKNCVKFVSEYFPGTLVSAKICIKPGNTAIVEQFDKPTHETRN